MYQHEIIVVGVNITDTGASDLAYAIAQSSQLIAFHLCKYYISIDGGGISDKGTEMLAKSVEVNKKLRVFYIRGDNISDKGAKSLGEAMMKRKNIEAFYLCHFLYIDSR